MENSLFRLPDLLPDGAVLLGPEPWITQEVSRGQKIQPFSQPEEAARWLKDQTARSHPGSESLSDVSRLIFIHQDCFAGSAGADLLVSWLDDLRSLQGPFLPILLHGNLEGQQLVRFFRAGLFDALAGPLKSPDWINMLIRAEKRLQLRKHSQLLLAETGPARNKLRELHNQIEGQATKNAGELLRAQESLEVANRQLTEAMEELSLLYKFGRELSQAANWDGVLRNILKSLGDFISAGGAALILKSAPGGSYSPRKTWHWNESSWDKVLVNLQDQVDAAVAESIMGPGVFSVDPENSEDKEEKGKRIIALPLEFQEVRLGYLLLMFTTPEAREVVNQKYLPFLQTVQVVLSEEIAGAQMLDRIRDIGAFNSRVLETVSSAIWVVSEEGKTVFCNRSGQEMLTGQASSIETPDEFMFQIGRGRHQDTLELYDELPELFLDARLILDEINGLLMPALRQCPEGEFRGEGVILSTAGAGIPVLVQTALMPGPGPEEPWLVIVAEDLRETRKLEAERARSQQLESLVEMSATLAHEIRNPLMGLSAQAELLSDHLPENDPKTRYIQVITGEVDRINNTITRMLNYVRPYEPHYEKTDLVELCDHVLDLAAAQADERNVGLNFNIPGSSEVSDGFSCELDHGQIKQVLLNLLINAIDAAGQDGEVELVLNFPEDRSDQPALQSGRFSLLVIDNGPGIAEDDFSRIFRPFFTTKNTGTGLGLSICQKIVMAHGGQISALRQDDSTVFEVKLPRFPEESRGEKIKQEEAQ